MKCSLDMSLFYRKTRGLVNRSVHKTPTFIIEPLNMALYGVPKVMSMKDVFKKQREDEEVSPGK